MRVLISRITRTNVGKRAILDYFRLNIDLRNRVIAGARKGIGGSEK